MISRFTLKFKSNQIENDYRQEQHIHLKSEFTLFSIQTIVQQELIQLFFVAYILYYFQEETFNLIVVTNILVFMVLILLWKWLIDKQPSSNKYILPFLQIYFAFIWNLDNFFPQQVAEDDYSYSPFTYDYNWYYGMQAFYFHFAVMQLGYQIWPQAVALLIIYFQYVTYYPSKTLEYYAMCLTILLVFIGLIMMKYTNEKTRRMQFRNSREQNNWIKTIDQILEQSVLVIKFDEKQDQLILSSINDLSKQRLKISNNKDMRTVLRDMLIIQEANKNIEAKKQNLEEEIRDVIKNQKQKLIQYQLEVKSQQQNKELKVKLIQSIMQEEECVILIFEQNQKNKIRDFQQVMKQKETFILFLLQQLTTQLKTIKTRLQIVLLVINLQQIRLFFNYYDMRNRKGWIQISQIQNQMNLLLQKKIEFNVHSELTGFITNQVYFFSILISLAQLFDRLQTIKLKKRNKLNQDRLKVSLEGSMIDMILNSKILKQNLNFSRNPEQNYKIILSNLQKTIDDKSLDIKKKAQIISIYLTKFLLWNAWRECNINIKVNFGQTILSFEFSL
ncbi:unnamed protein product (macronuclear) [Paramecium tetraurelia]|uniref:Transmembrane protein n=1 Tax=Paramecium tetraurelia TaxID=5888 RepID=A0CKX2_PARTE|nr:uncharacterized protein GSPATT00007986001 [Paramecium tetraurelia]CAK71439.1 unnamed protein product [Paramecium tetraurelia]|eukprot:XP_001438836.1 hypothetical protein (macronuclear) [Paramecium tetraurelia strain d4-2]